MSCACAYVPRCVCDLCLYTLYMCVCTYGITVYVYTVYVYPYMSLRVHPFACMRVSAPACIFVVGVHVFSEVHK